MILMVQIVQNQTGGISALVRFIGIGLAIWALVNPKAGLYIVTIEAFSLDFVKKLAVYYGSASTMTIMEVLIVGILAVVATITGFVLRSVAFRRSRMSWIEWAVLIVSALVCVALVAVMKPAQGMSKALQDSFNAGFYIALAAPMSLLLRNRAEIIKLLSLQFWLSVIWATWGTYQYFYGFTDIEWYYARTGLSIVASNFMLMFEDPRPFGFGSGAPHYGAIAPYLCYGIWHALRVRRRRLLFLLGSLIIFAGVVTSMQRTTFLIPFIILGFFFFFQTRVRAVILYLGMALAAVAGVLFSEWLLYHLEDINRAIAVEGRWGEQVVLVSTFSDRLRGWMVLKDPASYSLFGLDTDGLTHDIISRILLRFGIVALLLVFVSMILVAWQTHRIVFRIQDPADRDLATVMLAATVPVIVMSFAGGGNFTTVPINLQIWTFFGVIVAIIARTKRENRALKTSSRAALPGGAIANSDSVPPISAFQAVTR